MAPPFRFSSDEHAAMEDLFKMITNSGNGVAMFVEQGVALITSDMEDKRQKLRVTDTCILQHANVAVS